jgi:chromosome segregation ATPase
MAASKVNDKSTKAEIWEAYRQLLQEAQGRPVVVSEDPAKLQELTKELLEAKAALAGQFDTAAEHISAVQQAYTDADQELSRRKAAALAAIEQDKQQLGASIATVRKQWDQEKADRDLERQREEDTYAYNLNRKRRDETEAYERKAKERETALAGRETALAEREQQADNLAKQVETFPEKLEAATKQTREETAKELEAKRAAEVRELKQQTEHEKSILNLKLQAAEAANATQAKQIAELQRQLDAASAQLKDMAVTVIQAKSTTPATTPQQ